MYLKQMESSVHPSKTNYDILRINENTKPSSNGKVNPNSLIESQQSLDDNLFLRIRGFLIIGKIFGLIPCCGVFQKDLNQFKYRRYCLGSFISLCIIISLGSCSIVAFIGLCKSEKHNAADLAFSANGWIFYSLGTFLYAYFLRNAEELVQLFKDWMKISLYFKIKDDNLSRDTGIIIATVFTSAFLENFLLQINFFDLGHVNNSTSSILQKYYQRADKNWSNNVPYHWFWAVFTFVTNKFSLYGWNFADLIIAVFSRALYARFKLLNEAADKAIPHLKPLISNLDLDSSNKSDGNGILWTHLVRDHSTLCSLLARFESFLSPLVFCSYGVNIYYTCLQLLIGLTPSKSDGTEDKNPQNEIIFSVYSIWSFIHLIGRLYIVSICAANINVHAHQISRCLRRCPMIYYNTEVQRADRRVSGPEIGLTGLNCFVVSKPLILSIIGVVFTFEIVLLQSSAQPSCPTNCTMAN